MQGDDEIDKELQFHIEARVADLTASGLPPDEARRRTRLELGGTMQVKEAIRDQQARAAFRGLTQDVRIGIRQLRATPLVTAVAIFSLALGIGANTALYSLANSLLLRPLPIREPGRLALILDTATDRTQYWSFAVWEDIRRRASSTRCVRSLRRDSLIPRAPWRSRSPVRGSVARTSTCSVSVRSSVAC